MSSVRIAGLGRMRNFYSAAGVPIISSVSAVVSGIAAVDAVPGNAGAPVIVKVPAVVSDPAVDDNDITTVCNTGIVCSQSQEKLYKMSYQSL
jgi:hypothetical protein